MSRADNLIFAQAMVAKLEEQLLDSAGVLSVGTDGLNVQIDPDLTRKLDHWRKQVTRFSRANPRTSTVNLGNSHD